MTFWISVLLLATCVGVGIHIHARGRHRRLVIRQRRVERPNSYYSAPGVRLLADLERWGRISLDQLHPLNRDEVRRLLRLARATGSHTLSPRERLFLDTMAKVGADSRPVRPVPGEVDLVGTAAPLSLGPQRL
jgi:hypothetical protein